MLKADQSSVLLASSGCWIDIDNFEKRVVAADQSEKSEGNSARTNLLREAVELYRGEFLEGDDELWCTEERERLGALYMQVCELQFDHYLQAQDWARARCSGDALIQLNPLREQIHRKLMLLHYLAGDRALALRQYHECCAILDRQLSVTPMHRTSALYNALRTEDLRCIEHFASIELKWDSKLESTSQQLRVTDDIVNELRSVASDLVSTRTKVLQAIRNCKAPVQTNEQPTIEIG